MKNELREYSIEKRKLLNCDKCSSIIMRQLFSLEVYQKADNIICYYPLKYEISDIPCIDDKSKTIFLPRVNGSDLDICPYDKNNISKGSFKILEPQTERINDYSIIDLIIIPCVAADRNGYRIGYGKGYYDRLLKHLSDKTVKIILSYSELLFDTIYPEPFDIKADIVITENETITVNTNYSLSKNTMP